MADALAWVTTDPSFLEGPDADMAVCDGVFAEPLFHHMLGAACGDPSVLELAAGALGDHGWRLKGTWQNVPTGAVAEVERIA